MLVHISHLTEYRYSSPVAFGRHRLVLRPREGHDIRVESLRFTITPEPALTWTRDVFGNSIAWLAFREPAATLSILSEVTLTRHGPFQAPHERSHDPVPFPVVYDALESAVAAAYRATTYGEEVEAVQGFLIAEGFSNGGVPLAQAANGAEALLDALNRCVHERISYNRRPERGTQTPVETLQKKSGSCRDIATLLMEMCRYLGIAARFASGYLDCPASAAGRASTHAWTEVYLPLKGWIGFDPTLGEHTSDKHIPCGVSNHPRGVMPVSGTYAPATPTSYLGMQVAVRIEKLGGSAAQKTS